MPLKSHKYGIFLNYSMCIYWWSMPIYMPHMKLLPSMMEPESLYTGNDDDNAQGQRRHSPITYPELAT